MGRIAKARAMHIPATIRLSTGPASLPRAPMVRVSLTINELFVLVRHIRREADALRIDGQDAAADRLDWRAAALREVLR